MHLNRIMPVLATAMLLIPIGMAADKTVKPEACPMPKPTVEHQWLQQLVGEWTTTTESTYEPGKKPEITQGKEAVHPLGPFWVVDEVSGQMMGQPFKGVLTLGYDAAKKQYVGTWIDSNTGKLWNYTGKTQGQKLTLESEGECPMKPGKQVKFKEVLEVKSPDERTFTAAMQGEDGKWMTTMTSVAKKVNH